MILTVAQFKAHMADEVALDDDVLRVMLDRNENAINKRLGGDPDVAERSEEIHGNGMTTLLPLSSPASSILTITPYQGVALTAEEWYRYDDSWIGLTGVKGIRKWDRRVTVVYVPEGLAAERIMTLVALMKVDLNHEPGFSAQSAGPWQESYRKDHYEERESILDELVPRPLFA